MIFTFFKWWMAQLGTFIPAWLSIGSTSETWIVELSAQPGTPEATLWHRRNASETRLGSFTLAPEGIGNLVLALPGKRPLRVVLRAAPNLLLERQVVLPLGAEKEWLNVLRYEMDRLTPFAENQIFWTGQIEHRDLRRGTLALRLSMIPRPTVYPILEALTAVGLPPTAIEFAGDTRLTIGLADTRQPLERQRDPARILLLGCGALAMVALILPFAAQSYRGAIVARQIGTLQPAMTQAEALLGQRSAGAVTTDIFKAARGEVGDPLTVLAAVTQALPDNTFLTQLTLNHLQLNVAGQSAAAAPLLAALSSYPIMSNVAFTAPVTRDPGSHKDIFSIQAEVLPQ